ncbi:hypothetical protein B566_EDAN014123 [Ephemera danica]|nr:hypothetical protein B566_EDAN014123 [Ephemera danica]
MRPSCDEHTNKALYEVINVTIVTLGMHIVKCWIGILSIAMVLIKKSKFYTLVFLVVYISVFYAKLQEKFLVKELRIIQFQLSLRMTHLTYLSTRLILNDIQQTTKEIPCQEIEDHAITPESEDDPLRLPVHQINMDQNNIHMNDFRQSTTKEIRDHTIKVETGDDQMDLPEHQIDDEAVFQQTHKQGTVRNHLCKHCGIRYAHREILDWHIEHCHGPDPKIKVIQNGYFGSIYQCGLCHVKNNRFGSIIQHLINKHQFSKLPYQCNICQCRQFICKSLLLNHKLICNKTTSQVNYNDLQLNDIQEPTKEILCQEVEDHTITVESEDDSLSLPVLQINRPN